MAEPNVNNPTTQQPNPAPQESPVPLEVLNKLVKSLSEIKGSEWTELATNGAERGPASPKVLNERAAELGIKPKQLQNIINYLSIDPQSTDPEVVAARKSAFRKVITALKNNVPTPQEGQKMDQSVLDTWKSLTDKAAVSMEALENEWNSMIESKKTFDAAYVKAQEAYEKDKQRLEELKAELEGLEKFEAGLRAKSRPQEEGQEYTPLSKKDNMALRDATEQIKTLKGMISDAEKQFNRTKTSFEAVQEELRDRENALAQKKFELNAATMIASLPAKEKQITGARLAVLEDVIEQTEELTQDVRDQKESYIIAIQDFKDFQKDLAAERESMGVIQGLIYDLKTAIGHMFGVSELTQYQDSNADKVQAELTKIAEKIKEQKAALDKKDQSTSQKAIKKETQKALKALKKINELNKKIKTEQDKAISPKELKRKEQELLLVVKQQKRAEDPTKQYTDDEIRRSDEYRAAHAQLKSAAMERLLAQKDAALRDFETHFGNARQAIQAREAVYKTYTQTLESVQQQMGNMYAMGELSDSKKFDLSFSDDLQKLLVGEEGFEQMQGIDAFRFDDQVQSIVTAADAEFAEKVYNPAEPAPEDFIIEEPAPVEPELEGEEPAVEGEGPVPNDPEEELEEELEEERVL